MQLIHMFAIVDHNINIEEITDSVLIPLLGKTAKHVDVAIMKRLQEAGFAITKNQYIVLRIVDCRPSPQSALAMITQRDKGSLTRLIQSLERKGWVTKQVTKEDARVNLIETTEEGKALLNAAEPTFKNMLSDLETGISASDAKIAIKVIKQLLHNTQKEI